MTDAERRTVTTAHHPLYGHVTSTTNPLGHETRYTRDPRFGIPTTVTDPNGHTTTTQIDALGRTVAVWLPTEPTSGPATYRFGYDPISQPATVTTQRLTSDADYLVDVALHDGFGRVVQTQAHSSTEGQRTLTSTAFDGLGNAYRQSAAYDLHGSPGSFVPVGDWTGLASWTQTDYDPFGEPVRQTRLAGAEELWASTSVRSAWTQVDVGPEGQTQTSVRNAHGETVAVTEDNGDATATASYRYDATGVLQGVTAGEAVTTIDTNWLGWKTRLVDPDAGTWTYTHDGVGNITEQTDPRDIELTFTYDDGNRLTQRQAGDDVLATWTYNDDEEAGELGRLQSTTATSPVGDITVSYDHDARNRITQQRWTLPGPLAGTYTMGWTFDATDQVTTITYPALDGADAEVVTYDYDQAGRTIGLTGADSYLAGATFDAEGHVTSQQLADGIAREVGYDPGTLRPTGVTARRDAETVQDLGYGWDLAGRLTSLTDGTNGGQRQCFGYDGRDQLVRAFTGDPACAAHDPATGADPFDQAFAYASNGNLIDKGGQTVAYDDPAHPHAATSLGTTGTFGYDAAGNMTSRTVDGVAVSLTYDADNRLAQATGPDDTIRYAFDADGGRVLEVGADSATAWLGDHVELTATDGTVTRRSRYLVGDQVVAERTTDEGLSVLLGDHLGSITTVVPQGGAPLQRRFDPWGLVRPSSADVGGSRGFTAQPVNELTGWVWLGSRHYDPLLGRFTQPDTIVPEAGSATLNRYAYMDNNPQGGSDPSGHFGIVGALIGGAVGAVASYAVEVGTNVRDNGLSTQAFTDVDLGVIGRATAVGIVAGATGGLGAAAFGSSAAGVATGGAVAGVVSGQAATATDNLLSGRPITDNLLNPTQMLADGVLGAAGAAGARAFTQARRAAPSCVANSFTLDTPVLMADGTLRPIGQVQVGDLVWSTDVHTGIGSAQPVTAVIDGEGIKDLVELTTADGATLTATTNHELWDPTRVQWLPAGAFATGDLLLTAAGDAAPVAAVDESIVWATVRNLTVQATHTFHIARHAFTVHNCAPGDVSPTYNELRAAGQTDAHHIIQDAAVRDLPGYSRGQAPAIQLTGPSNVPGTAHYHATQVQRAARTGGTYGAERQIAGCALAAAGCNPAQVAHALRRADAYFMGRLGLRLNSPVRIPGNRHIP